jgi:polyketide biosynthesis enoyl-CoA hydratase PksH
MRGVEGAFEIRVPPAVNPESASRFARDFDSAMQSDSFRAIVLVGEERVFCRGLQPSGTDAAQLREHLQNFAACLLRMRFAPKPVIAVVDGSALGGGLGLAATADMVIASGRSTFGLPEALFGLVPAIILPLLLERMRPQECRLWMLSGHSRSANEALTAGLVDVTCPVEELRRRTARAVRSLSRPDGKTVQRVKSMTAPPDLERAVKEGVETAFALLTEPAVSARFQRFFEDGSLPWGDS